MQLRSGTFASRVVITFKAPNLRLLLSHLSICLDTHILDSQGARLALAIQTVVFDMSMRRHEVYFAYSCFALAWSLAYCLDMFAQLLSCSRQTCFVRVGARLLLLLILAHRLNTPSLPLCPCASDTLMHAPCLGIFWSLTIVL